MVCTGVCFPMGKGMYRVVHIPEDEAVLLNSREKAPYLICVEVLKAETLRFVFSKPLQFHCYSDRLHYGPDSGNMIALF